MDRKAPGPVTLVSRRGVRSWGQAYQGDVLLLQRVYDPLAGVSWPLLDVVVAYNAAVDCRGRAPVCATIGGAAIELRSSVRVGVCRNGRSVFGGVRTVGDLRRLKPRAAGDVLVSDVVRCLTVLDLTRNPLC